MESFTITAKMREQSARLMGDVGSPNVFLYIAIGTGTPSGSGLGSEQQRILATASIDTTDTTNDTLKLYINATATFTGNISEIAIYDAASGGNYLAYATINPVIPVTSGSSNFIYYAYIDID